MKRSDSATEPRNHLADLVAREGKAVRDNPDRLRGLLLDGCRGNRRADIDLLVAAVRHGLTNRLCATAQGGNDSVAQEFRHISAVGIADANWAIDAWAVALGVLSENEVTFEAACPVCRATQRVDRARKSRRVTCHSCEKEFVPAATSPSQQPPTPRRRKNPIFKPAQVLTPVALGSPPSFVAPTPPPSAPSASVSAPPPLQAAPTSRYVLLGLAALLAFAGDVFWTERRPATRAPSRPIEAASAPLPVIAAAQRWTIASIRARTYQAATGDDLAVLVNRGDVVEVRAKGDARTLVKLASGNEVWINPSVAVSEADGTRLKKTSCAQYVDAGSSAFSTLTSHFEGVANSPTLPIRDLLQMVKDRDPNLIRRLIDHAAQQRQLLPNDKAAATWYRWEADHAAAKAADKRIDASERTRWRTSAAVCSRAGAYADGGDVTHHFGWGINAFRGGVGVPVHMAALPYFAPREANAWALLALVLADTPDLSEDARLLSGSFVQVLRQTKNRARTMEFFDEIRLAADPKVRTAIESAIAETGATPGATPR